MYYIYFFFLINYVFLLVFCCNKYVHVRLYMAKSSYTVVVSTTLTQTLHWLEGHVSPEFALLDTNGIINLLQN